MKKASFALALCVLLTAGFTACNKIREKLFPAFETELNDISVTVPVTLAGVEWRTSSTAAFNLDSIIKSYTANTFGVNALSSVKVKSINVFLRESTELNNISNFETVALHFSSNTNTTPVLIASASIPDATAPDINITPANSPELKDYLKGTQLTYAISGKARRSTTKPMNAVVAVTLAIK